MWSYSGCCTGHPPAAAIWCWPQSAAYYPDWHSWVSKELSADNNSPGAQATIGGTEPVFLSIDYVKDAAAEASNVTITITDSTGAGVWNITNVPAGFQTKVDFASAVPGATVKLDVVGCTAQLKWCERV